MVEVLVEGNMGNYSINRSASSSNIENNGQNGCSTAINAGGTNVESNNELHEKSGSPKDSDTTQRVVRKTIQTSNRKKKSQNSFDRAYFFTTSD